MPKPTDEKYRQIKEQIATLSDFDATCLLYYLLGYNCTNDRFIESVDYWLNDPQYGKLSKRKSAELKKEEFDGRVDGGGNVRTE